MVKVCMVGECDCGGLGMVNRWWLRKMGSLSDDLEVKKITLHIQHTTFQEGMEYGIIGKHVILS